MLLFRSAKTACTPSGGPTLRPSGRPASRSSALKIWITYIQAYMPYESSDDSSNQPNMARPLTPCCPASLSLDPLRPCSSTP